MKRNIFIVVLIIISSIQLLKAQGQNYTFTNATGTFDDGSGAANYDCGYCTNTYLIIPKGATSVEINFTAFDVDYSSSVIVHDGDNASANIIASFSGGNVPSSAITSTGYALFIEFKMAEESNYQGWTVEYKGISTQSETDMWKKNNSSLYYLNGRVGIGIDQPEEKLDVRGGNIRSSGVIYSTQDGYAQTYLRSWGLSGNGTIYIEPSASQTLYLTDSWSGTGMLNIQFGKTVFETGNVLIGKTTQTNLAYKLDVAGIINATSFIGDGSQLTGINQSQWTTNNTNISYTTGNVGIGSTNPGTKLDVNGIIRTYNKDNSAATWDNLSLWSDGTNSYIYSNGDEDGLHIKSNGGNKIVLESNVLIGKTTQSNTAYKLDVAGSIRADGIKINLDGADFVFEKNYKLPTLKEVEAYIAMHKHLPDIAPAAEMQAEGVSVGDMQAKLLQKLEEMTLYMIEQEKSNQALKQQVVMLKQEVEMLKKKLK